MIVAGRARWVILGIFVLSTAINYLDRQALAMLAPAIRAEFALSNADYGWILTAFSLTYAAGAPFAGLLIDRIGLTAGITIAVAVWSAAGVATGFTTGLAGLVACRAVLGLGEAAGIPAAGKAIHRYLLPGERALGNAVNQAGVSLGLVLAPPLATWLAIQYGWRQAFIVTGMCGFLWIGVWLLISREAGRYGSAEGNATGGSVPFSAEASAMRGRAAGPLAILRQRRMWAFLAANGLSMTGYSLWTNWTTLYLVDVSGRSMVGAAYFAWIPPVFAAVGGFAGGWLSLRFMNVGLPAIPARLRVCFMAAVFSLPTAFIPLLTGATLASAGISLSILAVAAFSVNMYTLPLDAFGGEHAAFAVSLLVSAYGIVQAVVSPAFGAMIDRSGYAPVCLIAAVAPLAAYGVLRWSESGNS